jgi:PelA/Pel-15E family pectate lyase
MAIHRVAKTAGLAAAWALVSSLALAEDQDAALREQALAAMRRAATYYRETVAVQGGYVYYCSLDLKERLGEGKASPTQVWVQPPGTPTVGMAYLAAYRATKDKWYLDAARETAGALVYGQLASGGWTYAIDFDPQSKQAGHYRNGRGQRKGRNNSSLDDNTTQSALRLVMHVDQALDFKDQEIHQAAKTALDALLAAQFANGGWPQSWTGPAAELPIVKANFPDYEWRTEHRVKEYWNLYTLNDGLAGDVTDALSDALAIYDEERCRRALVKLGDFLVLAQLPEPQPAWAQQYDYEMHPAWARKFEPPAVTGGESQDAIETLLKIYRLSGDEKYLAPIPKALAYLKASRLPDGQLARFYELETNKPLYMTKDYQLTYDDSDVPTHYGFKIGSKKLDQLERDFAAAKTPPREARAPNASRQAPAVRELISQLDDQHRWVTAATGDRIAGQPKFSRGQPFISSAVFAKNMETLSRYVEAAGK